MRIWRTDHQIDLCDLPLDGTDMFLLTRIEGEVSLTELLAVSGCDQAETVRRVEQLVTFGLLKTESDDHVVDGFDEAADTATMPAPALAVRRSASPLKH